MTTKSETKEFVITGGVAACLPLQTPPRGVLERLILKQVAGAVVAATYSIFDRRGACLRGTDTNISSGEVATVTSGAGGKALLTFTTGKALIFGAKLLLKGCSVSAYNRQFVVTDILSPTQVLTDVDYTADGAGGFWQISPEPALLSSDMYLVHSGTVTAGQARIELGLRRAFENSDIKDASGMRNTYLWLELTPEGSGSQTWQVATSTIADALV